MRRVLLLMATTVTVLGLPATSEAGGNWIEFDEYYPRPGEVVTARLEHYGEGTKLEAHGPYYLWLTANRAGWRQPPPLAPGSIRLGEVRFLGQRGLRAKATFTLPDVEPGEYIVQVCNDPCTRTIAEVDSTWFPVVLDPALARVRDRLETLRGEVREALEQAENAKEFATAQQDEVESVGVLSARVEALSNRVEELEQETAAEDTEGIPGLALLAGLLAAAVAGYVGGRLAGRSARRRPLIGPPPDEMIPAQDEDLSLTHS